MTIKQPGMQTSKYLSFVFPAGKIIAHAVLVLVVCTFTFCSGKTRDTDSEVIAPIVAPFDMPQLARPVFPDSDFNIVDFGAISGGKELNTSAFAEAIGACTMAGGGKVVVPEGIWLTVPIELKSNVHLFLEDGAEIRFTWDKQWFFPDSLSRVHGDLTRPISPIFARDAENIAITGNGVLDGQGIGWWPLQERWWENHKRYHTESFHDSVWAGINRFHDITNDVTAHMELQAYYGGERPVAIRPNMFKPVGCKNILLEGFTIKNSPMWTINPVMCENIIIRRITIRSDTGYENHHTPNTDGIVPESCKNVLIEYCDIFTGDDSFAIKSGIDEAGRLRGIPSENIVIRHNINKRISIGSEMSGGVRNVYVHDCRVIGGMNRAIHIKTRRGRGGIVENLWFENIQCDTLRENAIFINMHYGENLGDGPYDPAPPEPVSERTPRIRNVYFKNISVQHAERPVAIVGLAEMPPKDIFFEDLTLAGNHGILCQNAHGVTFTNVSVQVKQGPLVSADNSKDIRLFNFSSGQRVLPDKEINGQEDVF